MSASGNGGTVGAGAADDDADVWVGLGLAEAAAGAKVGSVPVADIMAGGRRIRRRRRSMVGALALATTVVLAGGAMAGLHGAPANGPTAQALVPADGGPGGGTGGGPASQPTGTGSTAAKDPFTPLRVVIGQGTVDGKEWKLWEALWPTAPKERAFEQAMAVWKERNAVDPSVEKPTEAFVQHYWRDTEDVVNTYVTLDGVRQKDDSAGSVPNASNFDPRDGTYLGGGVIGPHAKAGTPGPLPIRLATMSIGPDVAKVVVNWTDGTKLEPQLVTVGDSPYRHLVVAEQPGKKVTSWQFFDRNGTKLPDSGMKMLSE
ncbi:hypothetical protein [Kitasatospora sp. NPDC087314]|uniref:hypothetical protein n=1 Tax=Kitasatospora sp. NPDC087314 TaxID=3364068 RepID=UPI0037F6B444